MLVKTLDTLQEIVDIKSKTKKKENVNSIEEIIATVSEINTIQSKLSSWWYNTCTTIYVSKLIMTSLLDKRFKWEMKAALK